MDEQTNQHSRRSRGGGIVGPALLIGLGVVLLMQQFGYIQWSIWEIAMRLWPLLIVAVGVELLIGRRSILGSLVSLVLVLGLLFGAIWMMGIGPLSNAAMENGTIHFARADVTNAAIQLTAASGTLTVDGAIADAANGLEAQIRDANWSRVEKSSDADANQGNFRIALTGSGPIVFPSASANLWQIHLNQAVPASLKVTMGAGEMTLHLEQMNLDGLDVKMGAGQINIYLPEKGVANVKINLGAGQVIIRSAKGTVLAVKCTTGVGNCSLPNTAGFWSQKYQSPEYESGKDKMNIDINIGAGAATVTQ